VTQRIVVATDGSPASDAAIELALSFASREGAHLLFLHAVDEPAIFAATAAILFDPTPTLRALETTGEALLAAAERRAAERHLPAKTRLMYGDPVDMILAGAQDWDADLIVMGTHGRRGFSHFLLGSTAERVLQRSSLPVLVTKAVTLSHCAAHEGRWQWKKP
jgi:nucleotide-binding universal stress UspA family protein